MIILRFWNKWLKESLKILLSWGYGSESQMLDQQLLKQLFGLDLIEAAAGKTGARREAVVHFLRRRWFGRA